MWDGMPLLPKEALERYDVDKVLTTDELKTGVGLIRLLKAQRKTFLLVRDRFSLAVFDSDAVKAHQPLDLNFDFVGRAVETCRVVKDEHEIAMIRHANIVSSYAHERVMAAAKSAKNERELNAVFVMHCHANGCRDQAYDCICASGPHASTLHYVHNDVSLEGRLNLLIDAGSEYNCYAADITRVFPLNGTFTKESRETYELVLKMQSECMEMIKAGVLWEDVHMHSHKVASKGLQDLGILNKNLSVEEILESKVTCRFYPHGLGHFLGMDCHDTGGNPNYEDPNEFFRYLRIRGRLPACSVVTNEPGIYFRRYPLEAELKAGKWDGIVDQEVLERYWTVGGVRIEDDILVKEDGYENLTTVGKSVDYIEAAVNAE